MAKIKGASKNWFATMELSETEQETRTLALQRLVRVIPVGAGAIVGQNECSGHACMPIAELHQQVREHKNG